MLKKLLELFIKTNGRKPNKLEWLQLKFKASQQSGKGEVVPFPKDKITDWKKPRPTEADQDIASIQKTMDDLDETMKEADAFSESIGFPQVLKKESPLKKDDFFRIKQGLSTKMKLNSLRENEQFAKDLINRKNTEFNSLNRASQKEILDRLDIQIKNAKADMATSVNPEDMPFAGGGIAGMLGERTGYDNGKLVEGEPYVPPKNFYNMGFGPILEDVIRDAPKKGTWTEKDLKYLWDVLQGEHDIENIEDEIMLRFGRDNPEKKSRFFAEIGKDKAGIGWKKQFAGGGIAGMLGEPTYEEDNHRVPLRKGKRPYMWQLLLDAEFDDMDRDEWEGILKSVGAYQDGGRVPFGAGGFNAARRAFLKWLGAGAATGVAAKSGLINLFKGGGKKAVIKDLTSVPIKNIKGMPVWFKPLVNRVIKEGEDVTKTNAYKERMIIHKTELPNSKTDVYVHQDLDSGDVWVDIGATKHGFADGKFGQPVRLEYKAGEIIEPTIKKRKKIKGGKTKEEFNVEEAEFTGGHPENIKFEETSVNKFGKHESNFDEVEAFATGKNKKTKNISSLQKQNEDLADHFSNMPTPDNFASGGRVPYKNAKLVDPGYFMYQEPSEDRPSRYEYNPGDSRVKREMERLKKELIEAGIIERKIFSEADRMPASNPYFLEFMEEENLGTGAGEATPEEYEEQEKVLRSKQEVKDGGRVPFSGGKGVLKGLAKLMDEFFPGTTKLGQTSKPMAEKTQLRKAIADFQNREKHKTLLDDFNKKYTVEQEKKISSEQVGSLDEFHADFVKETGINIPKENLKQAWDIKKSYPFNTPIIDKNGKFIGQEATQQMYPKSKKFIVKDEDQLTKEIDLKREGRRPSGERAGIDVPPVPGGFKLSREKLIDNFPEISLDEIDEVMKLDKETQARYIMMLKNRRLDPDLYDELLLKHGDTLDFQGEFDKAIRRKKNATGGIVDGRVGLLWGGGIYKTIIKNLAKERGVNPSTYLKYTNYKALPEDVQKYIPKDEFEKLKKSRIDMFENFVEMAKTRKDFLKHTEQGKKNEFMAPFYKDMEKSFGKSPVPSSVTDKDILQGEYILKNLKTKGRKLNATGGRVSLSNGGVAGMLGE